MDLWALHLKGGARGGGAAVAGPVWGARGKRVVAARPSSCWRRVYGGGGGGEEDWGGGFGGGVVDIRVSAWRRRGMGMGRSGGYQSLEVRAARKRRNGGNSPSSGSNDPSIPEGDASEGSNSVFDKTKPNNTSSHNSHHANLDWRTFRANLVAQEQVQIEYSDMGSEVTVPQEPSERLGSKWAHPIPMPETGCVLVATDKLDGVRNFERTVVLLLRIGTRDPRECPFGIIINRPLHKKIKHMKSTNPDLATTFADCSLHFGGPLDASMFLLTTNENLPVPNFEQVVPGICFGARNTLDDAAGLVKKGVLRPQDFRFFVGYAGWQLDQLREEIELDYWIVAACSSDLIGSAALDSSSGLWEEILELMGGRYSDFRKPKADDDSS